jgi:hypothetical protein
MIQRRSFLSAIGGALAVRPELASAQSATRHEQDDWMDKLGAKHRMVFDTTSPEGLGRALLFGTNFINVNKDAYGVENSDVGLIIVVRHNSTSFAYNDAMWAKYGKAFAQRTQLNDPKTKEAPTVNLFNATGLGPGLPNNGITIDSMIKRGAHIGVCRLATRNLAGLAASTTGGNADTINEELIANIVTNAHMVPAGIVAVNRAQERGYSFANGV